MSAVRSAAVSALHVLPFLSASKTNKLFKKTATKNTCFYMVANQIVKRSGMGVCGWMLSLSVPMCSFSPYLWWCDLQLVLVTKASPASLIKRLLRRQELYSDQ